MQYNLQGSLKTCSGNYLKNAKLSIQASPIPVNTSHHEKDETGFGFSTGDPDNVRRQKQDYSDKWAGEHHQHPKLK